MKHILKAGLLSCLLIPLIAASQNGLSTPNKRYLMIVTFDQLESGKNWMCRDRDYIQEPVSGYDEYSQLRKVYFEKYSKHDPSFYIVGPTESVMIYSYREKGAWGWGCESRRALYILVRSSLNDCKKDMDAAYQKSPDKFLSTPNPVFQWQGNGAARERIMDVDGLVCRFIAGKGSNDSPYIFAELRNSKKNMTALVAIELGNGIIVYEDIPPGNLVKRKIENKTLSIQVLFRPDTEPKPKTGLIELMKKVIRSHVTNEGGLIETNQKTGSMGVRG